MNAKIMLLLRTAFKNILAAGKRTWLNVAALSFTFVIMVAYNGLLDGWVEKSRQDTRDWQTGDGQLWHKNYDPYDIFTLPDSHESIPAEYQPFINEGSLTPLLALQASVYPQERFTNVIIKGIDVNQNIVRIPGGKLKSETGEIHALIGKQMSKLTRLKAGDRVMLRWRDRNGVFDAQEILIADVFSSQVPAVEANQLWMSLEDLYQMTGYDGEATYFIRSAQCPVTTGAGNWTYKDTEFLTSDITEMEKASRIESLVIYIILMSIALLAVFDTQMLSIFRRQKEIGTLVALGMTPQRVIRLFALEGVCFTLLAIAVSAIWGTAFCLWFANVGYPVPDTMSDMAVGMETAMYPAFKLINVCGTALYLIFFSGLVSWLAARKISGQNVVLLLKGKVN